MNVNKKRLSLNISFSRKLLTRDLKFVDYYSHPKALLAFGFTYDVNRLMQLQNSHPKALLAFGFTYDVRFTH